MCSRTTHMPGRREVSRKPAESTRNNRRAVWTGHTARCLKYSSPHLNGCQSTGHGAGSCEAGPVSSALDQVRRGLAERAQTAGAPDRTGRESALAATKERLDWRAVRPPRPAMPVLVRVPSSEHRDRLDRSGCGDVRRHGVRRVGDAPHPERRSRKARLRDAHPAAPT
jgi:hypothetical protein